MAWTLTKKDQEKLNLLNLKQWHDAGYKGQGIKILSGEDGEGTHDKQVLKVCKIFAPEAEYSCHGFWYDSFLDYVEDFKPNLITVSLDLSNKYEEKLKVLKDKGIPVFFASGNSNEKLDEKDIQFSNNVIAVGACDWIDEIKRASYSNYGNVLDFVMFTFYALSGTSFSTPALAGMTALVMQRYGQMNHNQVYGYWQRNCIDLREQGFDEYTGYGLPVLPRLEDAMKLEIEIDSKVLKVNGQSIQMDTQAVIDKNNRTLVPIRAPFEAMGYKVTWNQDTRTATIEG